MAYTKLFSSIISSTIWTEDDQARILWITLLAMADKNGEVQGSVPGLARIAGISLEKAEESFAKFLAPDAHSRTKDQEGRRLEEIDGGWALINHAKYREMASKDDSKKKNAERQKRFKDRRKGNGEVTPSNGEVTQRRDIAEAEAEEDTKPIPPKSPKGTWEASPLQLRLNVLFNRKVSTRWSDKEIRAFRSLKIEEDDLKLIEVYYNPKTGGEFRRRDLQTLLNNWNGEIDRARSFTPTPTTKQSKFPRGY